MTTEEKTIEEFRAENHSLKLEIEFIRKAKIAENIASVANNLIKWAGIIVVFLATNDSIKALAGKKTDAVIDLSAVFWLNMPNKESTSLSNFCIILAVLGILFGLLGMAYGSWQRKLRQHYIEYRPKRYEDLEKKIDPNRTSSMLTSKGDTRPEDI